MGKLSCEASAKQDVLPTVEDHGGMIAARPGEWWATSCPPYYFGVRTLGIGLMFERAEVMGYCGVMGGAHESNKSTPNVSVRSNATHPTS